MNRDLDDGVMTPASRTTTSPMRRLADEWSEDTAVTTRPTLPANANTTAERRCEAIAARFRARARSERATAGSGPRVEIGLSCSPEMAERILALLTEEDER